MLASEVNKLNENLEEIENKPGCKLDMENTIGITDLDGDNINLITNYGQLALEDIANHADT